MATVSSRLGLQLLRFIGAAGAPASCRRLATSDTVLPISARPRRSRRTVNRRDAVAFVDWCRVTASAGAGGDGCVSLARVFANAQAGPDGGDGGSGGHVLFRAVSGMRSLSGVRSTVTAADGVKGSNKECHGACAEHTVIDVPLGTLFQSADGELRASLDQDGDTFVAARGGSGGRGNKFFVMDTAQTPRHAERGAAGERIVYSVELRTMADVGLIGFPNAGKSTLLRAVSRARPRVASYPFTTLHPHVGMVEYSDLQQLAVADIPGLILDAHRNRGLGVAFLRHVQRCTCLLYVLDVTDRPLEQLHVLRNELEMFEEGLSRRPAAVVANKMDLPGAEENLEELRRELDLPVLPLAAKLGTNVPELLMKIRQLCDANKTQCPDVESEEFFS